MTKRAAWVVSASASVAYAVVLSSAAARHLPALAVGAFTGGFSTVSWLFFLVTSGLLVQRQPSRWSGPLVLSATLATGFGAGRFGLGAASPVVAAAWLSTILVPATLLLAHPDSLEQPWVRRLVGAAIGATAGLGVAVVLAAHGRASASTTWWDTPARQAARPFARMLFAAHTAVVVGTLSIVVVMSIARLAKADRAVRRLLRPVLLPGVLWAAAVSVCQLASLRAPWWALGHTLALFSAPAAFLLVAAPVLAGVSLAGGFVWLNLIVSRLQRTTAGVALDAQVRVTGMTEYLAAALADPSARAVFSRPNDGTWVDDGGRPAVLAVDDPERAVMVLNREGVLLGAIEFDASLASECEAVELAVTAAGLVMDNDRLAALANARAEDARLLTARLVTSADIARDQLQEQLAQPLRELDDLEAHLATRATEDHRADAAAVADRLQHIASAVREISHGLYPPQLSDGGLAAALPHATAPAIGRFAPAIEITVFMAADRDPSARITAVPGQLTVEMTDPPQDRVLLDRVAVLGGTIRGATITLPVPG
ncbi:MAG: hypothetical protein ACYDH6_12190 [Acidimicrobiales bacterium]